VINLHIGSSSNVHTTSEDAPLSTRVANHYGNCSFSLTDWLSCGAFLRYPDLRIAFSEGQAGWVPYLLSRLDGFWRAGSAVASFSLPEAPSSYLKEHVWFCVFDDPSVLRFLDIIGEDNICFETDYPHPDGSWPHSRQTALQQTGTLTPEQREKILRTNAAQLYRIERVLAPALV
jgi:predicted TIM-barrel fold metal-dependent hydrolase